jgi:hypothetical protein
MDPQILLLALNAAHSQIAAALWLSTGMCCAVGGIACTAFGWRRAALILGLLYSASLCLTRAGHAPILGPAGCGLAIAGLLWPRKGPRP